MNSIDIALTAPQRQFVMTKSPFPLLAGGIGSGKSRAGTMRAVLLLIEERGTNIGVFFPTYDLLRLRGITGVEADLKMLGLYYTVNKSTFTITVPGYGDIIFRSYDRPERIIAYEVAHAIMDELGTLPKDKAAVVWRKVSERVRQKCKRGNTIGVVTTPDYGVNSFEYEKWVKKQQPGYELIKAPTASNPFLPDDFIDQIRANYDEVLADLYLNGEFVSLRHNKVYHFFDRSKHHSQREIQAHDKYIYVGVDFNIGGVCASTAIIENNMPVFVDEFVSYDTHDFVNNLTRYQDKTVIVYPDATGNSNRTNATESDIAIIENAGFAVEYGNKNPAVRDRVNSVNRLLSHNRFRVNTDKCPEITHALETQGYTDKGEPEKYTEHPAVDDFCDSIGYFCNGVFPVAQLRMPKANGFYR